MSFMLCNSSFWTHPLVGQTHGRSLLGQDDDRHRKRRRQCVHHNARAHKAPEGSGIRELARAGETIKAMKRDVEHCKQWAGPEDRLEDSQRPGR